MAMMPLGYLIFGLLYDLVPAEYVVIGSSLCLIVLTSFMMRPSILKQAHPELDQDFIPAIPDLQK